ncbi:hypothetical protein EDB85DRAFT_2161690 [Lactarius pseudohatsudake]|nr:hypothetical protein EDB85DRAFT_2161690 [Lactarius pseudohatsudake]
MSRYYGYRQSFVDTSSSTTPRHQATREKLLNYVQESARKRMYCEDDVLQYYRKFICLSIPLVHTGHLSEVERDAAFWCGFHPKDRSRLRPPLLAKYPYQPDDDPFPFADVLSCARAAFAYRDPFPSWPQEEPYKPRSVRVEPPVVERVPRDTYGFRLAPRAVASNAETAPSYPLSPLQLTTDPQLPFTSSVSRSELHHTPETAPMPLAPPPSSISPTDSERPQPTTDVQPQNEPEPAIASPDIRLPSPSSPTASESRLSHAHSTADGQLEPVPLSSVTPTSPSLSLPSTPSLDSPSTGNVPKNRVPLPSTFPVLSASSDLPPATLSPSLVLGDLELKLEPTPASLVDSETVSLSSPARLPSSSNSINLPLPAPLKFSPSVLVSPCPSPISSTILTPPGLLKLSPNGPITPPLPSPLEATRLTAVGPISPSIETSLDPPVSPRSLPSPSPQRPPGLMPIASQVSTLLESSPPAPSTQSICRKPIPAHSTLSPLQVVFCSPSLSGPDPTYVDSAFPLPIPDLSVSDLVKTLSTHAHELWSKHEDLAGSLSGVAKPRDAFASQFQLEQCAPCSPSLVFDPGGLASKLDPAHEDAFSRSPRPRSASITESSITVPSRVRQAQRRNSVLVSCSAPTPSVNDDITSTPPPLPSSPLPCDPIPGPFTSTDHAPPRSFEPSHSSLANLPSSYPSSYPASCPASCPLLVEKSAFHHAPYLDPRLLHRVDCFRYHHHSSLSSFADVPSSCLASFPLVKESTFRHAPYLDPRLLCHICLFRPCFLLLPFITSLLIFLVFFGLAATASVPPSLPSFPSVQPSSTHTAHADARQRKSKTRGALITTHDTFLTTLVQADKFAIFSVETPAKLARRSLTGDGQDFDPPGDVRIARALAPKSHVFGRFDLGPASRGSATISDSTSHGVLTASRLAIDLYAFPSLSPSASYTHTHSLSLSPSPRSLSSRRHGPPSTTPSQDAPQPLVRRPRIPAPRAAFVLHHPVFVVSPISPISFKMSRPQLTRSARRRWRSRRSSRCRRGAIVVRHYVSASFVSYSRYL